MKTAVIYWSGTGNTEAMAQAVAQGIEETIENVAQLARDGMRETDKKIIEIMIDKI